MYVIPVVSIQATSLEYHPLPRWRSQVVWFGPSSTQSTTPRSTSPESQSSTYKVPQSLNKNYKISTKKITINRYHHDWSLRIVDLYDLLTLLRFIYNLLRIKKSWINYLGLLYKLRRLNILRLLDIIWLLNILYQDRLLYLNGMLLNLLFERWWGIDR